MNLIMNKMLQFSIEDTKLVNNVVASSFGV